MNIYEQTLGFIVISARLSSCLIRFQINTKIYKGYLCICSFCILRILKKANIKYRQQNLDFQFICFEGLEYISNNDKIYSCSIVNQKILFLMCQHIKRLFSLKTEFVSYNSSITMFNAF